MQYGALALLPLTHLVAIMRMITLPGLTGGLVVLHLSWIVLVTVVVCIIAINLMRRRLIV